MLKQSKDEGLAQQATFIFQGTVNKLRASTIPSVPVTEKTVVVRVDEILRAPDTLAHYKDEQITVQLGSREQMKKGERAIFYTNIWTVGESLAVQSVGHTAVNKGSAPARMRSRPAPAADGEADRGLQAQVTDADTVVTGKVISVRVLDEPSGYAAHNSTAAGRFQPISEHSPLWQEAVIEVAGVEKGEDIPKQIVARFPSSMDVRWYEAPKLRPGQEEVFLLKKVSKKNVFVGRVSAATPPERGQAGANLRTAFEAVAVQPLRKVDIIRTLIRGAK